MTDASLALQTAIFAALDADAPLKAVVTGIFDDVPTGTAFPFIQIGDVQDEDNGASLVEGFEHQFELLVWSKARGRKEIYQIMELVDTVLHNQTLTLTGHTLINLQRTDRITFRDQDAEGIRNGQMEYRAVTERI